MNSIADSLIPALEQLPLELILMNSDGKMKFHTGRKIWHQKDETNVIRANRLSVEIVLFGKL